MFLMALLFGNEVAEVLLTVELLNRRVCWLNGNEKWCLSSLFHYYNDFSFCLGSALKAWQLFSLVGFVWSPFLRKFLRELFPHGKNVEKQLSRDHSKSKPAAFSMYGAQFSGTGFETKNYAIQAKYRLVGVTWLL